MGERNLTFLFSCPIEKGSQTGKGSRKKPAGKRGESKGGTQICVRPGTIWGGKKSDKTPRWQGGEKLAGGEKEGGAKIERLAIEA